jgi:hypothetical protein
MVYPRMCANRKCINRIYTRVCIDTSIHWKLQLTIYASSCVCIYMLVSVCMCVSIYIYIYLFVYLLWYIYTCVYCTHVCLYVCLCIHIRVETVCNIPSWLYVYVYVCIYTCARIKSQSTMHIHVCVNTCTYTLTTEDSFLYIYIYIHVYIYIYTYVFPIYTHHTFIHTSRAKIYMTHAHISLIWPVYEKSPSMLVKKAKSVHLGDTYIRTSRATADGLFFPLRSSSDSLNLMYMHIHMHQCMHVFTW